MALPAAPVLNGAGSWLGAACPGTQADLFSSGKVPGIPPKTIFGCGHSQKIDFSLSDIRLFFMQTCYSIGQWNWHRD